MGIGRSEIGSAPLAMAPLKINAAVRLFIIYSIGCLLAMKPIEDNQSAQHKEGDSVESRLDACGSALEKIGPFELEKLLQQRGGWSLYLASDPRFDREVLVRIAQRQAFDSQEDQQRFEQGARSARVLSHPSIVPVFGSGKQDDRSFIVYERCPGVGLESWLEEQPAPWDPHQAAGLVQCLADAIQHAHQRDLLHLRLHPGNILIDRCVDQKSQWLPREVRIQNYGMGHFEFEQAVSHHVTFPYCSPEQRRGDVSVDATADIYSLGAILYGLLTGQSSAAKTTPGEPPGAEQPASDRLWPVDLDPLLQAIVQKCLSPCASDRYTTAFELADELIYWQQGRLPGRSSPTGLKRLLRWPR